MDRPTHYDTVDAVYFTQHKSRQHQTQCQKDRTPYVKLNLFGKYSKHDKKVIKGIKETTQHFFLQRGPQSFQQPSSKKQFFNQRINKGKVTYKTSNSVSIHLITQIDHIFH